MTPTGHPPSRIGFVVKALGRPGLKSNDARRWQSGPHLRVSLGYLNATFDYLAETEIRMYRVSSDIAPYATHPDLPQFHHQLEECVDELRDLAEKRARLDLRLSMHPGQYIVLNSPDERIVAASIRDFAFQTAFLDALNCGPEAKIITHVGGVYGDRQSAMDRFVRRHHDLTPEVQRRLVLENDEISYSVPDVLAIHARTGIPIVFDILHHRVSNPAGWSEAEACRNCLATWPTGQIPKIHYSTQRAVDREIVRKSRLTGETETRSAPPKAGQHDDWIDSEDFIAFIRSVDSPPFDVMLEAKQKDLALLKLRTAITAAGLSDRIW